MFSAPSDKIKTAANTIELTKKGSSDVYYSAQISFFGKEEKIKAGGDIFKVTRTYRELTPAKNERGYSSKEVKGTLKMGALYLVELTVVPTEKKKDVYEFVMLEDPLPAGAEAVERDNGYVVDGEQLLAPAIHREVRGDRVAFFAKTVTKPLTLKYLMRPVRPGLYHAMPAQASLMYYPHHRGYSESAAITIGKE
jgi:uncharacterized protein YfaS (alpha-2-macroglobulin family)